MDEKRFETEEFFSASLVEEIMKEFVWPMPYKIIDDDFSAEVIFPECTFLMSEDGEVGAELDFTSYKGKDIRFSLAVALRVRDLDTLELEIEPRVKVWPSTENMKRSIRNAMIILQAYFLPFIAGNDDKLIEEAENFH